MRGEPVWVIVTTGREMMEVPGWIVDRDIDDPIVTVEYDYRGEIHTYIAHASPEFIPREVQYDSNTVD